MQKMSFIRTFLIIVEARERNLLALMHNMMKLRKIGLRE